MVYMTPSHKALHSTDIRDPKVVPPFSATLILKPSIGVSLSMASLILFWSADLEKVPGTAGTPAEPMAKIH